MANRPMYSFDILLLGLRDPSEAGRKRFVNAMSRLTGNPEQEFADVASRPKEALFRALDRDKAQLVVSVLDQAGVRVEIRPSTAPPLGGDMQTVQVLTCPACGFVGPPDAVECSRCGLVFAKWERESVQRMQREARLEEALTRAMTVREEWVQRAKAQLEKHPLAAGATAPFEQVLLRDEVPFLALAAEEGPLLLTSRRVLFLRDGTVTSVPYELISDVDFGGGLMVKKGRVRFQLTFHSPLPLAKGPQRSLTWQLDKESAFHKEVVMDWAFARNFICGSCGARELEHRLQGTTSLFRCMRCATDHEVDRDEAVGMPVLA